ncbi:MAG: HEAT repeat domain-containing protein [Planctomycetota bacterium]|jgi:HEAT repeat protein
MLTLRSGITAGLIAGAIALPEVALAHGGSHPTPWPSPGTPAGPSGGTRPSRPASGGARGTGAGPKQSNTSWKQWWELNKWNYTSAAQASVILSGSSAKDIPTEDEAGQAKTQLTKWLLEQCGHDFFDVRSAAALALGKSGDKTATEKLVEMIDDDNRDVRESAVLALGLMKDVTQVPVLSAKVLKGAAFKDDKRLRAAAAIAMGFIGSKSATPELAEVMTKTKDKEVQYGCIAGLGLLKDESALPHLYALLANRKLDDDLRAYAATAIGKSGFATFNYTKGKKTREIKVVDELVKTLKTAKKERLLRQSCVQAIGALEATDKFQDIYTALDADRDQQVRDFSALVLARLGKKAGGKHAQAARARLEKLLKGRNHSSRGYAALALGLLGDQQSSIALRRSFENESDPSQKSACAVGLGLLKDTSAVSQLQGALMASNNAELRGYCCIALGLIGDSKAVGLLKQTLESALVPEVKAAAAIALASMGDQTAIPVLEKSLKERSNYVRQSTIVALGYFRNTRTITPIRKVYDDDKTNNEVRAICIVSLGYIIDRFDRPVFKTLATDFTRWSARC